jgi:spore coat protein SA
MGLIYHLLDEKEAFSEGRGGAISRWAANVLREGDEVVICPSSDSSWGFPAERVYAWPRWRQLARIHPFIYRSPWMVQRLILRPVFEQLLGKLKRGDMIYVHNRPAYGAVLSTLAPKYGVKVVLHMHNSLLLRANQGQRNALRDTPIVFVSEYLKREAHTALPNQLTQTYVVHNGADATKFRSSEVVREDVPTVIYTGRLVPHKGVHVLLKAMQALETKGVRAKCKVVGGAQFGTDKPSPYVRELHRIKPSNTELTGYMVGDAVADLLRGSDIFCCPSTWNDPFPLAPLEAMATGLPVIASDAGGFPEMFAHGGGVLVPPNDADALAVALEKMIEDDGYREELSRQARKSFNDNFLWSNVRGNYLSVVNGLLC